MALLYSVCVEYSKSPRWSLDSVAALSKLIFCNFSHDHTSLEVMKLCEAKSLLGI